jgi:SpoIIAA-like
MEEELLDKNEYENPNGKFKTSGGLTPEGIIFQKHYGFECIDDSIKFFEIWKSYYEKAGNKRFIIVNVSELEDSTAESRKYMNKMVLGQDSIFERIAIVGGNFLNRALANMYSKLAKIPMKLFKTDSEAMKWLKEGMGG